MLLLEHERNFIIVEKNFTIRWVFADMDEVFYVFRILFINGLIFLFVCSFCIFKAKYYCGAVSIFGGEYRLTDLAVKGFQSLVYGLTAFTIIKLNQQCCNGMTQ